VECFHFELKGFLTLLEGSEKRRIPWVVVGGGSVGLAFGGIGRAIVSGFQLKRVNREIKKLKEESNPSEAPQREIPGTPFS
jgi:hypothetical protein